MTTSSNAEQLKRKEIALIQMGRAFLGQDDDTYRAMLAAKCSGKTSSTQLTWQERKAVIEHYKACGFVVKAKAGRPTLGRAESQMAKLRAMWHSLAEVGAVEQRADLVEVDQAIEAWAKHMLQGSSPGALRFANGHQMTRLIEAMKRWCARVGAAGQDEQADPRDVKA